MCSNNCIHHFWYSIIFSEKIFQLCLTTRCDLSIGDKILIMRISHWIMSYITLQYKSVKQFLFSLPVKKPTIYFFRTQSEKCDIKLWKSLVQSPFKLYSQSTYRMLITQAVECVFERWEKCLSLSLQVLLNARHAARTDVSHSNNVWSTHAPAIQLSTDWKIIPN